MFYRDPSAEDNGILDGIIDLSVAKSLEECEVARNYGFMIMVSNKTIRFWCFSVRIAEF